MVRRASTAALALLLPLAAACGRGDAGHARATRAPAAAPAPAATAQADTAPGTASPDSFSDPRWVPATVAARNDERQRLTTLDGVLTITSDSTGTMPVETEFHLRVDGHELPLQAEHLIDLGIYASRKDFALPDNSTGTLVVLDQSHYGQPCPVEFTVLLMRSGRPPVLTAPFGTCIETPEITLTDRTLRMRFPGYYTFRQGMQPGFVEPPAETYEYRDGRMVKVAPRQHHGRAR